MPTEHSITGIQESGYITLSQNLVSFAEFGTLPFDIARFFDGQGEHDTLKAHECKWHYVCQLKYTINKLSAVKKR